MRMLNKENYISTLWTFIKCKLFQLNSCYREMRAWPLIERMSSLQVLAALLAVLTISSTSTVDDDFGFELTDDLEVEFAQPMVNVDTRTTPNITATVGRLFHVVVAKDVFGADAKGYEVGIPRLEGNCL